MSRRQTAEGRALSALRLAKEAEWRERVEGALRAQGGDAARTAHALGVSKRTLYRWLEESKPLRDLLHDGRTRGTDEPRATDDGERADDGSTNRSEGGRNDGVVVLRGRAREDAG